MGRAWRETGIRRRVSRVFRRERAAVGRRADWTPIEALTSCFLGLIGVKANQCPTTLIGVQHARRTTGKLGLPVEIDDDPLIDLVLSVPEAHPNAEERRLLYVALTRARRQVFLLAEGGSPSTFITELIGGKFDVTVFGRLPEDDVPCPHCKEGRLEQRENARDGSIFFGCSNWPYCEQTGRPCPNCGTGLPVRSGAAFRCRDCGGSIEGCPDCAGWLETKMGRFGRFLGCSNYPDCDYTRNLQ